MVLPVGGIRNLTKKDMKLNDATPEIRVDPQNYDVTVDGELVTALFTVFITSTEVNFIKSFI